MLESISLPEECWELIFNFLLQRPHSHHLETLSMVCKQFLSISNKLRSRIVISELTVPVIPRIFSRFRQLKHIDIQNFTGDLDGLLFEIAESGLELESLDISKQKSIPVMMRVLGARMRNLRSLICSDIGVLTDDDMVKIAVSFPNLEELDISYPANISSCVLCGSYADTREVTDRGILALVEGLPRLRKVNLSGLSFISDKALLALTTNCESLKELAISECDLITQEGIAAAFSKKPNLISISATHIGNPFLHLGLIDAFVNMKSLSSLNLSHSKIPDEFLYAVAGASLPLKKLFLSRSSKFSFSGILYLLSKNQLIEWLDLEGADFLTDKCLMGLIAFIQRVKSINLSYCLSLTYSSLFILALNCPNLNQIKMQNVYPEKEDDYYPIDFFNFGVTSLDLSGNKNLLDETLIKLGTAFPNLEVLKLNYCISITEEAIRDVMCDCLKMRHLEVNFCTGIKNLDMIYGLHELETLALRGLEIDDFPLTLGGSSRHRIIHLDLQGVRVSANEVKRIVKGCGRLREIDLSYCDEVDESVVLMMVFTRPSLRRITTPESFIPNDYQREFFLRHGCVVSSDA